MVSSIQKGKHGERLVAQWLRSLGFDARRTQQYTGMGVGDVIIEDRPWIHIEVKYGYPTWDLHASSSLLKHAIAQAIHDCPEDSTPVVIWRARRQSAWKMSWPFAPPHWATVSDESAVIHILNSIHETPQES